MNRRSLMTAAFAAILLGSPAFAFDVVDEMLNELREQGYRNVEVSRTLLGRTRITAENAKYTREIVVDPRTGEVLRDYWQALAAADQTSGSTGSGTGTGSGTSGSGTSGSGTGDDDDDDSSGSNSGSSGSGGSGSSGGGGGSSGGSGGSSDDD